MLSKSNATISSQASTPILKEPLVYKTKLFITVSEILFNHKWENAFTIDMQSWSYRENMHRSDIMRFDQILEKVITTVSCGGEHKDLQILCDIFLRSMWNIMY